MAEPLISVIIPTYNRAYLLSATVASVLQQTYQNIEVLVVDDASDDDTEAVIAAFDDERVYYVRRSENGGAAAARNTGIFSAHGTYVAFLDSDDRWTADKLQRQQEVAERIEGDNFVVYSQVIVDDGQQQLLLPRRGKRLDEAVGDYVLVNGGLIHTSALLLPTALVRKTPFSTRDKKHEDWDLFLRFEQQDVTWHFIAQALAVWDNEQRADRLTKLSYDVSLRWLRDHESLLSMRARHGFMLKEVASQLLGSEQRRIYTVRLILEAAAHGAISPGKALKLTLLATTPRRFRRQLLRVVRHRRQKTDDSTQGT